MNLLALYNLLLSGEKDMHVSKCVIRIDLKECNFLQNLARNCKLFTSELKFFQKFSKNLHQKSKTTTQHAHFQYHLIEN